MNPLICALHEAAGKSRPAPVILFGMSMCRRCARGAAQQLAHGASVRAILRAATEGHLP